MSFIQKFHCLVLTLADSYAYEALLTCSSLKTVLPVNEKDRVNFLNFDMRSSLAGLSA